MKKKLLGGIALSVLFALPAMAADLPARTVRPAPVPVIAEYNWSGFYIGAHAGYGFGDLSVTTPAGVTVVDRDFNGFVGGGHVGINWQWNRLVLGLEGAVSFNGSDTSGACVGGGGGVVTCDADMDHFWRAGGRVGFAAGQGGNWLFYGMGGYARAKFSTSGVTAGGVVVDDVSTHHSGWYAGGGIEYAIGPNFILGVEAYHVSLGSERVGVVFPRDVDLDFTVVQARASYKFNWWTAPVTARY